MRINGGPQQLNGNLGLLTGMLLNYHLDRNVHLNFYIADRGNDNDPDGGNTPWNRSGCALLATLGLTWVAQAGSSGTFTKGACLALSGANGALKIGVIIQVHIAPELMSWLLGVIALGSPSTCHGC